MDIINFGSLNLDYIYKLNDFVSEGETLAANSMEVSIGGKGLNQSIALARAGQKVCHVGLIGKNGLALKEYLDKNNIDTSFIKSCDKAQGHAIIQIDNKGRNCIIIYGGSNKELSKCYIDKVMDSMPTGGYLNIQNEISNIDYIIEKAYDKNISVIFNASPIDNNLAKIDYSKIKWLIINEIEGQQITGFTEANAILKFLETKYPDLGVVITLGEKGSICTYNGQKVQQQIYKTTVVDTTAAGDTFLGFFVACIINKHSIKKALQYASAASAIAVSRPGAAESIPAFSEVVSYLDNFIE